MCFFGKLSQKREILILRKILILGKNTNFEKKNWNLCLHWKKSFLLFFQKKGEIFAHFYSNRLIISQFEKMLIFILREKFEFLRTVQVWQKKNLWFLSVCLCRPLWKFPVIICSTQYVRETLENELNYQHYCLGFI